MVYSQNHSFSLYLKNKLNHITSFNRCNNNHCRRHFSAKVYQRFEYLDWMLANRPDRDAFNQINNLYHIRFNNKTTKSRVVWYFYNKSYKDMHDQCWNNRNL